MSPAPVRPAPAESGTGEDRDWLLWAIECAEAFARRWRTLPGGQPVWTPEPNAVTCELRPRPASARLAREFARRTVSEWGWGGLAENVGLVVSELVTNALQHVPPIAPRTSSQWWIQLSLAGAGRHVMCAVTDPSDRCPTRQCPDLTDESGRGLHLVDYFSSGWGWLPRSTEGKVVWALFNVDD